jgi:Xaa-Pro dipeptidase
MNIETEFNQKVAQLREVYRQRGKSALIITQQNNVSWLLRGRTFVNTASTRSLIDLVITDGSVVVVVNNVEAARLASEEFPFELETRTFNWFSPEERVQIIEGITSGDALSDTVCEAEISALRSVMTPLDAGLFAELGADCARAMEETCLSVKTGMSEFQIAGLLSAKCFRLGIEPIVNLIAADERVSLYRHPLPTEKRLKQYAMLVLCGRRFGQVVSLTRFVAAGELPAEILKKRDALHSLDALLFSETRPGALVGDILSRLCTAYGDEGYADEWKLHHQGGLAGYESREVKALPGCDLAVKAGQVYAWNPSITGYKSEDSFIVGVDENRIITETRRFPYRKFEYNGLEFERPEAMPID